MAYPSAHILVKAIGHFGTSGVANDNWSTGLRIGIPGADVPYNQAGLQTFVQAAFAAFQSFHADPLSLVGTACWLDYTSAARIGTDGHYDPLSQKTVVSTTASTAGSGSVVLPWNTAHVISLRTANVRGYASNGRCYYPYLAGSPTGTTGRLTTTQVNNRVQNFKTLINSLNTAANTYAAGAAVRVFSNNGAGYGATVTSLRADDRLDSIERRENKTPSVWQTTNIP